MLGESVAVTELAATGLSEVIGSQYRSGRLMQLVA
jgi:hypothetical protein